MISKSVWSCQWFIFPLQWKYSVLYSVSSHWIILSSMSDILFRWWNHQKSFLRPSRPSKSLGLQRDPTSPFWRRSALGFLWKEWCSSWNSSTLATSCEELTHWKRLGCWEGLGARGEGDDRGWDGWMASLTRWTWVSVNSGNWWWTGRPGVLRFMGLQRVGHDWVTELNWTDSRLKSCHIGIIAPAFLVFQFSSVTQSCLTLCDSMNCSTPGFPVHHQFPEFTQTHIHRVGDAIQPSHPLSSPSPLAPNPSQHPSLFQWVNSSHEVAKVLEFQL